ncbi:MAG: histone deacetylase, partial [Thermodesulfobacteriota bacterium]
MRKTAVFRDSLFLDHDPGFDHVESPERLKVIYEVLDRPGIKESFLYPEFEPAPHKILALNHSKALINRVSETACKIFDSLDPDTKTSPNSYAAACLAAGALLKGVDLLMEGEIDNG